LHASLGYGAQVPAPLDDRDFGVPALTRGAVDDSELDSAALRRLLGAPDSIVVVRDSLDSVLEEFPEWYYRDIVVSLGQDRHVEGVLLKTSRYLTARGLRVGDGVERLMKLYGKATRLDPSPQWVLGDGIWTYHGIYRSSREEQEPVSREVRELLQMASQLFGMIVWVRDGKVACVYVGKLTTELSAWGC